MIIALLFQPFKLFKLFKPLPSFSPATAGEERGGGLNEAKAFEQFGRLGRSFNKQSADRCGKQSAAFWIRLCSFCTLPETPGEFPDPQIGRASCRERV